MKLFRLLFSGELYALGLRDLRAHKLRSLLTALGVIFGVGAVICMLSIGEGASAEQLESIRLLGSRNIIIRSVPPQQTQQASQANTNKQTYGVKRRDLERIEELPFVERVVNMREVAGTVTRGSHKLEGAVLGTTANFFDVVHVLVERGRPLAPLDEQLAQKVCVIGANVADALFEYEDPLGQTVHVVTRANGPTPYTVVGVLGSLVTAGSPAKGAGRRDMNREVFIPLATADRRYGDIQYRQSSGAREIKEVEVSDVYVNVDSEENVIGVSQMVARLMEYGRQSQDYAITVPLELLLQAERDKKIWQIVLGSIAGISLLVGGIGIMNIMLASVTERTREIGIRRALGAKRRHITAQFLVETVMLSVSGGVIGILVGIGLARLVTLMASWETIVPWWGVALSFLVSVVVGISFGLYPARAAAALDPIEALRYE